MLGTTAENVQPSALNVAQGGGASISVPNDPWRSAARANAAAGVMNLGDMKLPDNAWYHLCDPIPFMQAVRGALIERGIPPADVQYEVFGPDLWQADLD